MLWETRLPTATIAPYLMIEHGQLPKSQSTKDQVDMVTRGTMLTVQQRRWRLGPAIGHL